MSTDAASLPDDPARLKALLLREREFFAAERERFVSAHATIQSERDAFGSDRTKLQRERATLQRKCTQLEKERESLQRDQTQWQREREQHTQVVTQFEETVEKQQRKIEQQQHQLAQLLRRLFGPKQERFDPNQLSLFDFEELQQLAEELTSPAEDEDASSEEDALSSSSRNRRKGHGRRPLPEHLPREQRRYELSEEERRCPCCGDLRQEIGSETSEQLEYVPASLTVIEHVRVKYACRQCAEHVALAAKPPQPIEKGLPGPGLLAQVVLSKYGDHLPLYRQEDIFARHGVVIRRSTLCDWIAAAADVALALYLRMGELVRQSKVIHTDDTTVPLLDPLIGRARPARFWAYIGDAAHPYTVFDFTESRRRDGPATWLDGFRGYLQADAYGGYDGLYRDPRQGVIEVACWTHTRRYWWEAKTTDARRAHHALAVIARLYKIEEQAKDAPAADRRVLRQEYARPIVAEFLTWLDEEQPAVLPKSPIGEAFRYTLNQWAALQVYLSDGDLAIDNNVAEQAMKIPAIGRKNWLFVATATGGRRAAILLSLVASAKANQVEPWAWLEDLFTHLPATPADALDHLLPDRWLATHPQHRWQIDALRRQDRAD
jgi:transposase